MELNQALEVQLKFRPPYCPNEKCLFHPWESPSTSEKDPLFYETKGWPKIQSYPYQVREYRCKHCWRSFRYSYFQLEYRMQKRGLFPLIFRFLFTGASNHEIARQLSCTEPLIRRRLDRMAQWAFLKHAQLIQLLKIQEPIAYDGLENFSGSQYDPNHIQQAIGKDSLFVYDFNYVPLNRKGRMSDHQKRTNSIIERTEGRYLPKAIRVASQTIFQRLYERRADPEKPLILYTDEHFQYRRAIERDLKGCQIQQVRISSKQTRNYQNILFPVNHADLNIRQQVGAFSRETICFSKTAVAMIKKYALYAIFKNYFRPQFTKKLKRKPQAHLQTPAMALGLVDHPMSFYEFFDVRRSPQQVKLNSEWNCFYQGKATYERVIAAA
jgi:hypothetical protein